MATHELKVWPEYFEALTDGSKTFEVRKNDRGFEVGDTLVLREWDHHFPVDGGGHYTGRECQRTVTYVLHGGQFGIEDGYCVMGLSSPRFAALERLYEAVARRDEIASEAFPGMAPDDVQTAWIADWSPRINQADEDIESALEELAQLKGVSGDVATRSTSIPLP